MFHALLLALPLSLPIDLSRAPLPQDDVRKQFVALYEKKDEAGLAKLWKENPYEILTSIDEDLEGALAVWEKAPDKPDEKAIAEKHARALWGARIASEATGHPIFADYTTSYVGFTTEQKKAFRGGQAAHGRARKAMKAGDNAAAAKAGRECADLALPLGDWWGYAMGLSAEGQGLAAGGEHEKALASLSQARVVYHDLGLVGDEYSCTCAMAKSLAALKRNERALATVNTALAMCDKLEDKKSKAPLLELKASIETASGDTAAAEATRKELEKLGKK